MGCVYSYPLFSFQGSICFSTAKIILSNLHFLVKYYFSYLIRFCLLFFRQRMIFYQVSFSLSSTFLFIFLCLFSLFMSADISISSAVPLVNVFLFKHSLLTNAYTLFRLLSCSDIYLLYTLNRKCQHLFSPFFDIFSSPSKKGKGSPFPLESKLPFYIFFYVISAPPVHPPQSALQSDGFPA